MADLVYNIPNTKYVILHNFFPFDRLMLCICADSKGPIHTGTKVMSYFCSPKVPVCIT